MRNPLSPLVLHASFLEWAQVCVDVPSALIEDDKFFLADDAFTDVVSDDGVSRLPATTSDDSKDEEENKRAKCYG